MIILDTSAIISLIHKDSSSSPILQSLPAEQSLCITSITLHELFTSLKLSELPFIYDFLTSSIILPYDQTTATISANLSKDLSKKGKTMSPLDLFIASICLQHQAAFVTLDKDFTCVPGLRLVL